MLRLLNLVLCLAMIGLAVLQSTRPAPWLLVAAFVVVALWAFLAGFRHRLFQSVQWLGWLWASVAAGIVLVWQHWPQVPEFWRYAVWSHDAAAREGVALLLALATLLVALVTAYRKR
jgi:hypothetical protein